MHLVGDADGHGGSVEGALRTAVEAALTITARAAATQTTKEQT
ncbi:MAG: hypothetical protein QM638_23130 [Nocardioides sp.]